MTTNPDVFWHLFCSSGHVGAYLLYAWCDQASSGNNEDDDEQELAEVERDERPWYGDDLEPTLNGT